MSNKTTGVRLNLPRRNCTIKNVYSLKNYNPNLLHKSINFDKYLLLQLSTSNKSSGVRVKRKKRPIFTISILCERCSLPHLSGCRRLRAAAFFLFHTFLLPQQFPSFNLILESSCDPRHKESILIIRLWFNDWRFHWFTRFYFCKL